MTVEKQEQQQDIQQETQEQKEMVSKEEYDALKSRYDEVNQMKKQVFDELHTLKAELKEIHDQKAAQQHEKLQKEGKIDEIIADYQRKIKESEDKVAQVLKDRENEKLDSLAQKLAVEAGASDKTLRYLQREIRDRLTMNEGNPAVLDTAGKLTINSVDELVRQIQSDDAYAPLILSKQNITGGGAPGSNSGAVTKKFNEMSAAEKDALHRKSPQEYERIKAQSNEQREY